MPSYWWVNQGGTYELQREGGYLFASSASGSGRAVPSWETLKEFQPGDVVFHYAQGFLRALGQVSSSVESSPHPEGERAGAEVNADMGYKVDVDYSDIEPPIALEDIPIEIRDPKLGPFTAGKAVAGVPQQGTRWRS
jgi:hypothetical protein